MGWIDFSEDWSHFVKYVRLDVKTLINDERFTKACWKYVEDYDLDIEVIDLLERDRELKLAQMSD
jgi:hypothetical protein